MGTSLKIMFFLDYGSRGQKDATIEHRLTNDEINKLTELARNNITITKKKDNTEECFTNTGSKIYIYINGVLVSDEILIDHINYCSILEVLPVKPVETQTGGENTSDTPTVPPTETSIEPPIVPPETQKEQVTNNEPANSEELPIDQQQKSNKLKLKMINPEKQTIFEVEFEISKDDITKFNEIKKYWFYSDIMTGSETSKYIKVLLNNKQIYKCNINKNQNDIKSLSGGRKTRNKYNHKKQTKRNKRDKKKTQKKHNKRRNKKTQR
jgi:hypothetical protein